MSLPRYFCSWANHNSTQSPTLQCPSSRSAWWEWRPGFVFDRDGEGLCFGVSRQRWIDNGGGAVRVAGNLLRQADGQLAFGLRHFAPEFLQVVLHVLVVGVFAQG